MVDHRRLPWDSFDSIARGHPDPGATAGLRASVLSRHLLLLREVARGAGPLRRAWDVLAVARRADPAAVDRVLAYPYVGAWLAACLANPAERHTGYLANVAAACAIRASVDFELALAAGAGTVALPTLGVAVVPARPAVPVTRGAGRVHIGPLELPPDPARDGPGWTALRYLAVGRYRVALDDLDPYRTVGGDPASYLSTTAVARWRRRLDEAWDVLVGSDPAVARRVLDGIVALTPLRRDDPAAAISASTGVAVGAVALTEPPDALSLAVTLRHEYAHSTLHALRGLVDLCRDDGSLHYGPWRSEPRPLPALLNGAYAFLADADFWHARLLTGGDPSGLRFAGYEFTRRSAQVRAALADLGAADGLTPAGRRFVAGMSATAAGWHAAVPPRSAEIAELALADHRVGWLLRHRTPEPLAVRALAAAWLAGRPPPPLAPPLSRSTVDSREDGTARAALWPLLARSARADPRRELPDLLEGDLLLADGRYARATAEFRTQIPKEAGNLPAWSGLAVARQRLGDTAETRVWRACPELVLAVYEEIVRRGGEPPAPERLARWLAPLASTPR